ncbi:MAG TPA: orotate phosphoribosyltransferase [Gemmatimonadales bacterium]
MTPERRASLFELLETKALQQGEYTLSAGGKSDFYFNTKMVTQDPQGLDLVADAVLSAIKAYKVDAVGGIVFGAVPIATAASLQSRLTDHPVTAFFVRHKAKEHGLRQQIEGPMDHVHRVAIVDDVVTSGRSVEDAVKAIQARGIEIAVIVSLVDRDAGGRQLLERYAPYAPVFERREFEAAGRLRRSSTARAERMSALG